MNLKDYIATIPDFPQEGILFRDITPLMTAPDAFQEACKRLCEFAKEVDAQVIMGPESRGFIFGCPVAYELGIGFIPVRKPGKLPRETVSVSYDLEYGTNELHVHADSIQKGQRVLIIDDLLATGGTVDATIQIVKQLGGEVVGCAFLIELLSLKGRELLKDYPLLTLMSFE